MACLQTETGWVYTGNESKDEIGMVAWLKLSTPAVQENAAEEETVVMAEPAP